MTQRERQASIAVSDAVQRPPSGASRHQPASETAPPSWDALYRHATTAQQTHLLALAQRQGLLFAHQLPATANGSIDPPRQLLARLFGGHADHLPPVPPVSLDFLDHHLDANQREAVTRALATPDLCLIQGFPGTGKSRVAAEIVHQATRCGERVLLLGSTAASIDRVLEQVVGQEAVCAVRCVAADEPADALPPNLRRLTIAERCRDLRENGLPAAHHEAERAEQRRDRLRQDAPLFQQFDALAEAAEEGDRQTAALQTRREMLAAEIERDAANPETAETELAKGLAAAAHVRRQTLQALETAEAALRQRQEDCHRQRDALAPELDNLRPLGEAKQQGRWWTGVWWQATFAGNVPLRLADLEKRCREIETTLLALEEESRQRAEERAIAEQTFRDECRRQREAESVRRLAHLEERAAALVRDRQLLEEKWRLHCRDLSASTAPPATYNREAVATARETWRRQLEHNERQAAFAREWAVGLAALADAFPARLVEHANLVAATTDALAADEHFGDRSGAVFDLLLLEESLPVTESEFLAAARRARRWVLVSEPEWESPAPRPAPTRDRSGRSRSGPASPAVAPRWSHRLWQALHFDPRSLPYAWMSEDDRLCCRLRALAPEQRQWLQCERVADFPDIELRIWTPPRGRPALAEVVFPPSLSIGQAKEYIFRELQELPIRARSHSLRWEETPERVVLRLCESEANDLVPVDLGEGVREWIGGSCHDGDSDLARTHTCRLEFDRQAGWQRHRAEEWVQRHTTARDRGRTVRLDTPHRMNPELAAVLSDWLFAGAYRIPRQGTPEEWPAFGPPVQFVPVPALVGENNGSDKPRDGRRGRSRGGAGLELDLADPRHRDRLPSEFRAELPAEGLVNFLEAQAVVRALEKLAGDVAAHASDGSKCSVGVLALYPAQARLIRGLIRRGPALLSARLDILVDVPDAFRERECSIALVSLTRSHPHRAVTFGEGPHRLILGLTRARSRLILFGDPGTLARRVEWDGAVDNLDDADAARERELLSHLVRYFHGGDRLEAAPVHQGSRS